MALIARLRAQLPTRWLPTRRPPVADTALATPALVPWALIRIQLRALLRKNWLLKRRAPVTTAFEVLLPVLFMCLLVFGFTLSEVEVFGEGVYNGQYVNVAGLVDGLGGLNGIATLGATNFRRSGKGGGYTQLEDLLSLRFSIAAILTGPLPVPSLAQFVGLNRLLGQGLLGTVQNQLLSKDNFGSLFGNILTLGTLHLSPDTPPVRALRDYIVAEAGGADALAVRMHTGEPEAVSSILDESTEIAWALVHFEAISPCALNYTIRANFTTLPSTFTRVEFVARGLDTDFQKYLLSGVLTLQRAVHGFVLHLAQPEAAAQIMAGQAPDGPADVGEPLAGATLMPMSTARYSQNVFYRAVGYLMGFFMANSLMYPVSQIASWVLTAVLQFSLTALLVTAVMTGTFLAKSDKLLVFCYVEAFLLSTVSLALLLSTCFSRAKFAAVGAPMIYIALVIPKFAFFTLDRNESTYAKLATCLLSPSAFAFGADFLADYEYAEVGVTRANAASEPFSFAGCIAMMLLDAVLYLLAALYLDHTLPTQYGATHHPLWCLPSWLRPAARSVPKPLDAELIAELTRGVPAVLEPDPLEFATTTSNAYDGIHVCNLVKAYGSGAARKVALKGVSLRLARGRISCLLGHNGAGKTSLISVLTGLYPPSSGDCLVFGHSIADEREKVYARMGLCPQHDVLWARLTVGEHMALYAAIKGSAGDGVADAGGGSGGGEDGGGVGEKVPLLARGARMLDERVERARVESETLLAKVGLAEKSNAQALALSGGMKRKLCVAIALLGDSSAVLLDEPTSGHYMDEADLLGDRTAILADGRLQADGSSLFLKAKFGLGYTLTVQLALGESDAAAAGGGGGVVGGGGGVTGGGAVVVAVSGGARAGARGGGAAERESVLRLLRAHVPGVLPLSFAGNEAAYRLPLGASGAFAALLRELDVQAAALGVGSYGMSMTSMDEVFLALARRDPNQLRTADGKHALSRAVAHSGVGERRATAPGSGVAEGAPAAAVGAGRGRLTGWLGGARARSTFKRYGIVRPREEMLPEEGEGERKGE
ncbi:hypothetical protein T492DRAFT_912663, partial [Pavlovales sp. CCMP2436]